MLVQRDAGVEPTGVRRRVSIFFADIRNFTEFIDTSYARAEVHVQENKLSPTEAEQYMDLAARDLLGTVNLYLSTIAEVVRAHNGTLDKYVGDAVMAFWGAPVVDERHPAACVHAAIAAQVAIGALNLRREAENKKRQQLITTSGYRKGTMPMLPILTVGMAVNSGEAIVGFMGSAALMSNYTVFGAEVNIASRLEGLARSGRIVISDSTHRDLKRLEPALAASCIALEPVTLRGIRKPMRIYEVAPEAAAAQASLSPAAFGI
jgi:adenylate cyclase